MKKKKYNAFRGIVLIPALVACISVSFSYMPVTGFAGDAPNGRTNLSDEPPSGGRFKITDREWPTNPGEASICLWKDDALMATSITIDDNCSPDHAWWLEKGREYDLRFTWFVITGRVKDAHDWGGSWENFNTLFKAGHDIQSHTRSHFGDKTLSLEDEYVGSKSDLESNIPGDKVLVLAYPGGAGSERNSIKEAMKTYIAARGTAGHVNRANQINYGMTNSISGNFFFNKSYNGFDGCLDPTNANFRAWYCVHYHGLNEKAKANLIEAFELIKSRRTDVWFGLFREIALYGQERDTAKIKVTANSDKEMRFVLSDDMDDTIFDYPLTVKLRLPDVWDTATATQAGKTVEIKLLIHENAKFVIVKAVPDRGEVVVAR